MKSGWIVVVAALWLGAGCDRGRGPNDRVVDGGDGGERTCADEPGSVPDGWPCQCSEDCGVGAACIAETASGIAGGACLRPCALDDAEACGADATCLEADDDIGQGACNPTCSTHDDCPRGRSCFLGSCLPACFDDAECDGGLCDPYQNLCVTEPPGEGAGLYGACVRNEDCKSGHCDADGRCFTECLMSRQNCPDDGVCIPTIDTEDLGECRPACDAGACADGGLECRDVGLSDLSACLLRAAEPGCRGAAPGDPDAGPCGCDADCAPGTLCVLEERLGAPGGFCARGCTPDGGECGEGLVCAGSDAGAEGICYESCAGEEDCLPGRICVLEDGICAAFCDGDEECFGGTCNPYSHRCGPVPTEGAGAGEPCHEDSECKSESCAAWGTDGGFCTGLCRISAQSCPDGAVCFGDPSWGDEGLCATSCANDDDCPGGTTCTETIWPRGASSHCE